MKSTRLLALLVCLTVGASVPLLHVAQTAAQSPFAPARISPAMADALMGLARVRSSNGMGTPIFAVNDVRAVVMISNRWVIARGNMVATEQGGRYAAPDDALDDIVNVTCGSGDRTDRIFECTKMTVSNAEGKPINPILYGAEPRQLRNALGATWTVNMVAGQYHAADLRGGFTIDIANDSGVAWTFKANRLMIEGQLLLNGIDPTTAALSDCITKSDCP
ncbi:MAG: hypothetical protein ABL986_08510 [Vicinamibacterales bacterium]